MTQPIEWTDAWHGPDEIPEYAGMHLTTRQGEHGSYVQANWFNIETREWTYRPYGLSLDGRGVRPWASPWAGSRPSNPLIAWTRMPLPCPLEREHPAAKEPTIAKLDIDDVIHETASKPR